MRASWRPSDQQLEVLGRLAVRLTDLASYGLTPADVEVIQLHFLRRARKPRPGRRRGDLQATKRYDMDGQSVGEDRRRQAGEAALARQQQSHRMADARRQQAAARRGTLGT